MLHYKHSVYAQVVLQATKNKTSLEHIPSLIQANDGEKGFNRDCHGQNAEHLVVEVNTIYKIENANTCYFHKMAYFHKLVLHIGTSRNCI